MEKRKMPQIGAGSMADIAFLLLIFFLVTTTIQTDTGLSVLLPVWNEEEIPSTPKNQRNVLTIQINSNNQLMVEDLPADVRNLKATTKHFLLHEADSPKKAVVSLRNDNGTPYDMYIAVYNELKAAYRQIWDDEALRDYGQHYDDLKKESKRKIRKKYPLVISEADPSDFAIN